ncbi:MAG: inorganic phosphate transporter PiT family [Limisphaerales bacterium]|nr:MAG: inorganic phosphate transporter PiT family [Limisphaerales bacterium]KAG0506946.1 MAG: inorganic phosphate transporter PiT family [Limisphaerales bacterium]TXT49204.1 MAG: inorganic phosphate transporter PiT family [Limisphaerales bacterium]
MTLVLTVVLVALIFEYINGFHDTANSIATVVSTKVLTPRQAIVLAATTNLAGALVGTAVAKTISSGLVDAQFVSPQTIICALLGGIVWNLLTWWFGMPSSSTHAMVGGLVGATFASAHGNWAALIWSKPPAAGAHWYEGSGLLYKVVIPMISSPLAGLVVGFIVMSSLYTLCLRWRPRTVSNTFGKLQIFSAGYMGFSHGQNDAQKTMGIIALALLAGTKAGDLAHAPEWLNFLKIESLGPKSDQIPIWIKVTCALTMAAGTAAGGWRIIKTLGHKMVKLQPVHGFAAETTAATVLFVAAKLGMPVSTTHAITTSIMGVGSAKRLNAIQWSIVERIVWAWVLTLPATAGVAYMFMRITQEMGWAK